jgi:hypothetical protein
VVRHGEGDVDDVDVIGLDDLVVGAGHPGDPVLGGEGGRPLGIPGRHPGDLDPLQLGNGLDEGLGGDSGRPQHTESEWQIHQEMSSTPSRAPRLESLH